MYIFNKKKPKELLTQGLVHLGFSDINTSSESYIYDQKYTTTHLDY